MPQIAYCTDEKGYYTHSEYCTTDPLESARQGHDVYVLPANGYIDAPSIADGCVAKRVNGAWVNVENHIGEKGYINGVPTEIKEYGPLPDGWRVIPPEPTLLDVQTAKRREINAGFDAALTASLTMPSRDTPPSVVELAIAIADFKADDPAGLTDLQSIHEARRASLLAAVDAATTIAEVQAISVTYAV
ncbi:phage tail protein [uncultured Desulfovibrio sp.]|uniref:phage tail protein n=1 Tax=uncultured Desulfovibrio sp. TaxID=167968 RepID=UPI0028054625|nr:phage tail protein [uncultured Desulfovibrio sp.]